MSSNACLPTTTVLASQSESDLHVELRRARDMQEKSQPPETPVCPGISVAVANRPANTVSGDCYGVFPVGGVLVFYLADVSGHGVSAGFVAAMLGVYVRCLWYGGDEFTLTNPSRALAVIQRWYVRENIDSHFLTMIYGVIDPVLGTVCYASAGHPQPVSLEPGRESQDGFGGPLICTAVEMAPCWENRRGLRRGPLVFFTDGVVEARCPYTQQMYGRARLRQLVADNKHLDARQWVDLAMADVLEFTAQAPHDDITLLAIFADE